MLHTEVKRIFAFHPADTEEKRELHEAVRDMAFVLADWINDSIPDSAEKTLAIRKVQEAMFYANSAIAQHYKEA